MRKLGVAQETKVSRPLSAVNRNLCTDWKPATIWTGHDVGLYDDYDVYMGICHTVIMDNTRRECKSLTSCSFFTTSFLNGGGVTMIYGFILAFFGALATCASMAEMASMFVTLILKVCQVADTFAGSTYSVWE